MDPAGEGGVVTGGRAFEVPPCDGSKMCMVRAGRAGFGVDGPPGLLGKDGKPLKGKGPTPKMPAHPSRLVLGNFMDLSTPNLFPDSTQSSPLRLCNAKRVST